MPVRIYTLAKELKLDSKELVNICDRAGVPGKGSALASLTDEEVAKVKEFLAGPKKGPASTATAAAAPPSRPSATPQAPGLRSPEEMIFRRQDYIAPAGIIGRPVELDSRTRRKPSPLASEGEEAEEAGTGGARTGRPSPGKSPASPRGPQIKLAKIPTPLQPPPPKPVEEPAPQKPDLKLPIDAIRAGRTGAKPLSEHIRKHDEKRRAEAAKAQPEKDLLKKRKVELEAEDVGQMTGRDRRRRGLGKDLRDGDLPGGVKQVKRRLGPPPVGEEDEEERIARRDRSRLRRIGSQTVASPRKTRATVSLPCTVAEFSEGVGVPVAQILGKLLQIRPVTSKNALLDPETIEMLALELGIELDIQKEVTLEQEVLQQVEEYQDDPASLVPRPPVVTFLGHVDHGKTSLLDRIIGTNVVSGESGGITQHIRAYQVVKDGRSISFVDTPGHEAFTQMRARGANVTDIAVLVVAADDGVMPQTEEAISHARAAGVPIVVALNKIDLPTANPQRVFEQLAAKNLLPTEWGGDTEVVKTSAVTGEGVDALLETLLTIAELHEFKANPNRPAVGTCLDAELHEGLGAISKMLVQKGTLRIGDVIVCGTAYGRVKALFDTLDTRRRLSEAGPSCPVNVTGLGSAPNAGERFYVLSDIAQAREIAQSRAAASKTEILGAQRTHVTLESLFDRLGAQEIQTLNIILKADVRGSIEAIKKEFSKLTHPEVRLHLLHEGVGGITEGDVSLAHASDAIVIGFNVVPDEKARSLAEQWGVQIRRYEIIYKVTEDIRAALEGLLRPEERETDLGRILVQRVFHISRVGNVAGCRVLSGSVQRNARIRVIRDSRVIGEYAIESLKREKDDVREVRDGMECGIKLAGFNDVKEGDILEAYKIEEIARALS